LFLALVASVARTGGAVGADRARDLGIPFDGKPGRWNAITDVDGVEVGHVTLISGEGKLKIGTGPIRTGVTSIFPRGKRSIAPVFAGCFALNGAGEMTGTHWVDEAGVLEGPITLTNGYSVGTARDGVLIWLREHGKELGADKYDDDFGGLPVVAETWDGDLSDVKGFHVKRQHVLEALDAAKSGPVAEGNVGGGTGMICYDFKGGIGTSSRKLSKESGGYTVGVLVQCNFGQRDQLRIAGVPFGKLIPLTEIPVGKAAQQEKSERPKEKGSLIIVIATDAPLLPHQLKRLARRGTHGLARTGGVSGNGSGDLFIAFSTANVEGVRPTGVNQVRMLANGDMDGLFTATVQAAEEAIVNALVAARDMTGADGYTARALPHKRIAEILKKYKPSE
jgi:L-aminopeptidase/D-esterase-like protein